MRLELIQSGPPADGLEERDGGGGKLFLHLLHQGYIQGSKLSGMSGIFATLSKQMAVATACCLPLC